MDGMSNEKFYIFIDNHNKQVIFLSLFAYCLTEIKNLFLVKRVEGTLTDNGLYFLETTISLIIFLITLHTRVLLSCVSKM